MVRFSKITADGLSVEEIRGISTEEKPVAPEGSTFYCMDTGETFYHSAHGWIDQTAKMPVSITLTGISETQYEGAALAGTPVVTVTYDDETTDDVTDDAIIDAPELLAAGENEIRAVYIENGIRVDAAITVTAAAKELSGISITINPEKLEYNEGESFDAAGAAVTATYNNGQTADVTDVITWTPSEPLTVEDTTAIASYTEGEITRTDSVAITVTGE